jgi:transcriptional regulator with XRE-family HTH domain
LVRAVSEFGSEVARLLSERGMSLRQAARLTHYDVSYLSKAVNGRKPGSRDLAAALDKVLDARGKLMALAPPPVQLGALAPADEERLAYVTARPRRVDAASVEALSLMLDGARRLDDRIGSAPMLAAVRAQLGVAEELAAEARGEVRPAVLDVAAQWAQLHGWLSANTGRFSDANGSYDLAIGLATETGDVNMISTALNMKGFVAWLRRKPGAVIGLSRAAQRDGTSPGVRALAAQQEARGHAITGDAETTERILDEAHRLTLTAAEHPEDEPPWIYFFNPDYLGLQRARAYLYLPGRAGAAAELLTAGLAALAADVRRTEWVAWYVADLANAYRLLGEHGEAANAAAEAAEIAGETCSKRLAARAAQLQ